MILCRLGTVIEFNRGGTVIRLTKHEPAYQFKTPFWWNGVHYVRKKDIPNNFIVIEEAS